MSVVKLFWPTTLEDHVFSVHTTHPPAHLPEENFVSVEVISNILYFISRANFGMCL